ASRIDRQLLGRAGRQGDEGSGVFFVSAEDELVTRYAPALVRHWSSRRGRGLGQAVRIAQWRAQRLAQQRRRSVLREDDWVDEALRFAGREL
ncbi:MAG: hypothetical protein KC983_04345, partial [Phycisphaerales bacterium]|nr:hypothetical protein [Phycisphaerales bacterium]